MKGTFAETQKQDDEGILKKHKLSLAPDTFGEMERIRNKMNSLDYTRNQEKHTGFETETL